jgi:alpha-galactosidase
MLRHTPIDTRFNVAMFGVMGFELLFSELNKFEKQRCKKLIEVYKANRKEFQFGDLYKLESNSDNFVKWQVLSEDKKSSVVGHFNILQKSNAPEAFLDAKDLIDDQKYDASVVTVDHNIHEFGGLVNMLTPFHLNPNGWLVNVLSKHITIPGEKDKYVVYGSALNNRAVILNPEWSSSGLNDYVRVLGDFGSRIYLLKAHEEN